MPTTPTKSSSSDVLARLTKQLGKANVLTAAEDTAPYLTDWRGDFSGAALAVLLPSSTDQVASVVKIANANGYALIPQGGNTGLCGGATPDDGKRNLLLSMKRLNRIRQLDAKCLSITVEAGCTLEQVKDAAAEAGFLFPLDLAARGSCQIGGNLSTNAGGLNVLCYGTARQQALGIEVVLPDGRVLNLLSSLRKDNTGYALKDLFIGAEGTLGIITAATLKLWAMPNGYATAFIGLREIEDGISLLNSLQASSAAQVTTCELIPQIIIDHVCACYPDIAKPLANPPQFSLLLEIASSHDGETLADSLATRLNASMEEGAVVDATIANSEAQRQGLWRIREMIPEAEPQAGIVYKSDIAVPTSAIAEFYTAATAAAQAICPKVRVFGFGHMGDGNLHFNLAPPSKGDSDFPKHFPAFDSMLMELLAQHGGSISAEHGIGQKKRGMLKKSKPEAALDIMRTIKQALDPQGIMNPGKII